MDRLLGVKEESDQRERNNQVRVEVKSFASRRLLQLADIAHVHEQMRAITERLGNAVVKIGEGEAPDPAKLESDPEAEAQSPDGGEKSSEDRLDGAVEN